MMKTMAKDKRGKRTWTETMIGKGKRGNMMKGMQIQSMKGDRMKGQDTITR